MDRINKAPLPSETQPNTDRKMAAVTGQRKLATVPAAWPTGVSSLARAVDACQRRDTCDVDWLARAPNSIIVPPVF